MARRELHAISNENSPFLFSQRSRILEPRRAPTAIHTLGSMSSAAAAADAPEEFAALAEYAVDDFMSEAASDVEVFATLRDDRGPRRRERRGDPLPGEGPTRARPRHEPRCSAAHTKLFEEAATRDAVGQDAAS